MATSEFLPVHSAFSAALRLCGKTSPAPRPTPTPKPKTYTVKFKANGGKLPKGKKMSVQTFTSGKAKKLRGNAFTRNGFVFVGWAKRKNGPVAYKNAQKVKNLSRNGGTVKLYAVWKRR